MPRRRQRGVVSNSPRSTSASPEGAVDSKDFRELKECVQSILARLEVLEKVFVFVDIEQINDVLTKYHGEDPSDQKAGIDSVVTSHKWEALQASRVQLNPCIPEETCCHSDQASTPSSSSCHPLMRSAGHQTVQDLAEMVGHEAKKIVSAQNSTVTNARHGPEIGMELDASCEFKQHIWDAQLSALDEDEQKSTCSTWDLCSTRDGLDAEADIEPELFHKFMRQALRPQWESRVKGAVRSGDEAQAYSAERGPDVSTPASTTGSGASASNSGGLAAQGKMIAPS